MTDLFAVCWVMANVLNGVACTGYLPTYELAVQVATHDRYDGLSNACIRRVVYSDETFVSDIQECQ